MVFNINLPKVMFNSNFLKATVAVVSGASLTKGYEVYTQTKSSERIHQEQMKVQLEQIKSSERMQQQQIKSKYWF